MLQTYSEFLNYQSDISEKYKNIPENMKKEEINVRFVKAVEYLLKSNNELSKSEIATSLGIKATKFSEILNFRMNIGTDLAATICQIFNINPTWLLTGEGLMLRSEEKPEPSSPCTSKLDDSILYNIVQSLQEEKKEKEQKIEKLTEELRAMERKIGSLEAELRHAETLGYRAAETVSTKKSSSKPKVDAHSANAPLNE